MEVSPDCHLYAACSDAASKTLLDALELPRLTTLGFDQLERWDSELESIKTDRSQAEYAQTAKASLCLYVLDLESRLDHITFLDADLFFLADPEPLFQELAEDSILIVPHRRDTAPEWTQLYGIYNSGSVVFRRDGRGLEALEWWRARCIEWCFQTPEGGRYTDQRYLNDWPDRFDGVHVLQHLGGGLAPWNGGQYSFGRDDHGALLVETQPAIFYHVQSLQLYRGLSTLRRLGFMAGTYRLTLAAEPLVWDYLDLYPVSEFEERLFWLPYAWRLSEELGALRRLQPHFDAGSIDGRADARRRLRRRALRRSKEVRRSLKRTRKRVHGFRGGAARRLRRTARRGLRRLRRAGGRLLKRG